VTRTPDIDCLVVGAGVVGLAVARALALAGRDVIVVDRHPVQGVETSSRSSEVIHAGIYYAPRSLKAQLCVAGRDALYDYVRERSIPHRQCGKIIIASGEHGAAELRKIRQRAEAAGAGALEWLDKADVARLEPEVVADAALLSPLTGIVDSHELMLSYLADLQAQGGQFVPNTAVRAIDRADESFAVLLDGDESVTARAVVNAAGLHSGRLAAVTTPLGPEFQPAIRYAQGAYFRPLKSPGFRHLVYPLPTNASLGVHATLDLAGQVRFGPDVEWIDDPEDYLFAPERAARFAEAIREYWPGVDETELVPDYTGIRPKLCGPSDSPADFRIDGPREHGVANLICLHGIESPGLTSSLALGDLVAKRLFEAPLAPNNLSARG
jgi:L-2-hydroxyglutarate oxidase LhgO